MNRSTVLAFVLLAPSLIALSGCARQVERPIPPVPPPRAEMVPLPPVSDRPLIWQPGDWDWTGGDYLWTPGRYVPRGDHGTLWLPGHWEGTPGQQRWVPGRWL